jgi:hypothetical protein
MLVIRRLIVVVAALAAGFLGTALAFPPAAVALAGRTSPPPSPLTASPALIRPLFAAASSIPVKDVAASYSCDFSKYATTSSGTIPPATDVKFNFAVPTTWPVAVADDIVLTSDATISLPGAVSSQLTGVDDFNVTASVTAKSASSSTVTLAGDNPPSSTASPPTEIPVLAATGQVTFPQKGTGSVGLPAQTITITPIAASTTATPAPKSAITCTTTTAAADVSITVGDASGPFYTCVTTVGLGGPGDVSTDSGLSDLNISVTGTEQVGNTVTVQLGSDAIATLIVAVTTEASQLANTQLTKATFTSSLAVTGAQSGTLKLPATITDLTATSFSASGTLKLTKAGTVNVDIPGTWDLAFFQDTTKVIDVACTLVTKPAPVGQVLTVTAAGTPSASPSASESTQSGGAGDEATATQEASGEPSGGAATGGGTGPGGSVPLMMGGAALFLTGGVLVLRGFAARGRRRPKSGAR